MNTQATVRTQQDGYEIDPLVAKTEFVKMSSDPMAFENELVNYGDSSMEEFNADKEDYDYRGRENKSSLGSVYSQALPELETEPVEHKDDWTLEPRTVRQLSEEEKRAKIEEAAIWDAEFKKWEEHVQGGNSKLSDEKHKEEVEVRSKSQDQRNEKRRNSVKFRESGLLADRTANISKVEEEIDCSKFQNETTLVSKVEVMHKKDNVQVDARNNRVIPPPRNTNVWNAKRKAEEDKLRLSKESF
jgi:hypothetical protein